MLKAAANGILRWSGMEVRRKPAALIRSDLELPLTFEFAAAHLATRVPGEMCVVQVGAFDGEANDPVIDALRRFDWRGVLVEPQPGPFAALKKLHEGNDAVELFNVAISDSDGRRDLFWIEPGPGIPDFTQQVASFRRAHVEAAQKYVPSGVDVLSRIKTTAVETWTFETLLARSVLERIDVLQIDAEGFDYELLAMFDFATHSPWIVAYEHTHLSRADRNPAADLLTGNGYYLAMSFGGDTVGYRIPPAV